MKHATILTARETATILHALRLVQEAANGPADCTSATCEHFEEHEQLNDAQIDRLCERLNFSDQPDTPAPPTKPLGLQMADDIASALLGRRSTTITLSPAEVLAADLMGKQARAARGVTGFDDKHQAWVKDGKYLRCGHDPMMAGCNCYGRLHEGEPVADDADIQ